MISIKGLLALSLFFLLFTFYFALFPSPVDAYSHCGGLSDCASCTGEAGCGWADGSTCTASEFGQCPAGGNTWAWTTSHCSAPGATVSTTYTCRASANNDCEGIYLCGSCAPTTCATSCGACPKTTTCGNTTLDSCDTSPCSAAGATSTTLFRCEASGSSNCE